MNRRNFLLLGFGLILVNMCHSLYAADMASGNLAWSNRPNSRTGLYSHSTSVTCHTLSFSLDGLYYFGDVESPEHPFTSVGFQQTGWMGNGQYSFGVLDWLDIRTTLGGIYLRGNNSHLFNKGVFGFRWFETFGARVAVGAEFYPIPKYGFYLYAGLGAQYGHIYYQYNDQYKQDKHSIVPMMPLEIGYNFAIQNNWLIGVHLGCAFGLADIPDCNVDAFPINASQRETGSWTDGYVQLGITVGYNWDLNGSGCRCSK